MSKVNKLKNIKSNKNISVDEPKNIISKRVAKKKSDIINTNLNKSNNVDLIKNIQYNNNDNNDIDNNDIDNNDIIEPIENVTETITESEESEDIDDNEDDIKDEENEDEDDDKDKEEKEYFDEDIVDKKIEYTEKDIEDNCVYDLDYDEVYDTELDKQPIQVLNEDRITKNIMTIYEKVRVLGIRAQQINNGAKCMIKINQNLSAMEIAKLELDAGMTPLKIKRILPSNKYEIWKISELIQK
jgi:DNA-directed RNA polymerase subunit K/omega